jgi:hypothetical protein
LRYDELFVFGMGLDENGLKEEVDEIAKWDDASAPNEDNNSTWSKVIQL